MTTLVEELRKCGVLPPTGSSTKEAQPQPVVARQVQQLPGGLDVFLTNADQPAAAEPNEVEQARQAMLARAAYAAVANETAQQRFERARARMRAAGLYQS